MKRIFFISALLVAVTFIAIKPTLKFLIDQNFTQISIEQHSDSYLKGSSSSLANIKDVDFEITISAETIKNIFNVKIDEALKKINQKPIDGLGVVKLVKHSLKLSSEPMNLVARGGVTLELPEHEIQVTANLDIRAFARIEKSTIIYTPALADIEITELDYPFWESFGIKGLANETLMLSVNAINGAISENRYPIPVLELPPESGTAMSFRILDREILVASPKLGSTTLLIDNEGLTAIGDILSPNEEPIVSAESLTNDTFDNYRNSFLLKVKEANPGFSSGNDNIWLDPTSLTALALSDPIKSLSVDQVKAKILGEVKTRLGRITDPTLAVSIDKQSVKQALAVGLEKVEERLNKGNMRLNFTETPKITLGEGVFIFHIPVAYSHRDLKIDAILSGVIGATLNSDKVHASGAIDKVIFKNVTLTEPEKKKWPVDRIANLASSLIESTIPVINGVLNEHPIPLPIKPLVAAGESAETIAIDIAGREFTLPPPMVEDWAVLVHPDGITVVAQIIPYNEKAEPIAPIESSLANFDEVIKLMSERTKLVDPNFNVAHSGFRISESMLQDWLAPIGVPVNTDSAHLRAIKQSHQQLRQITGPDIAIHIPTSLLEEVALDQLEAKTEELKNKGLTIEPGKVGLSFGEQSLTINFPFHYEKEKLTVEGEVTGEIFVGFDNGNLSLGSNIKEFRVTKLSVQETEGIDTNAFAGSISILASQLIPVINSALEALKIEIPQLKPLKIELAKAVEKTQGLTVTPGIFEISAPKSPKPLLLISNDQIFAIADLNADYLSKRPSKKKLKYEDSEASEAFTAYRKDFEVVWNRRYSLPKASEPLRLMVSTNRLAETIESLWKQAGMKFSYTQTLASTSGRHPVAAIPTNAHCKIPCSRPSCNRDKACKLRTVCNDVTEVINIPTKVKKEVCHVVNETITNTVNVVEEKCKDIVGGLFGKIARKVFCGPVTVTKKVTTVVPKTVCEVQEVIEKVSKKHTKRVCQEVADAACLATLNQCTAKWKLYDACALPFKACTESLKGIQKTLATIDFDKLGYVSTETNIAVKASGDAALPIAIGDDLRSVSLSPQLVGSATTNAKLKFEARASSLLGCVPLRPLELKNYKLRLKNQKAIIAAQISPMPANSSGQLKLGITFDPIVIKGSVSPAPLTKLLLDNPDTLITCPLVGSTLMRIASAVGLAGSTKLTRKGLEKAIKAITNDDKMPVSVTRLLLEGKAEYDLEIPDSQVSIPSIPLTLGSRKLNFIPNLTAGYISYTQEQHLATEVARLNEEKQLAAGERLTRLAEQKRLDDIDKEDRIKAANLAEERRQAGEKAEADRIAAENFSRHTHPSNQYTNAVTHKHVSSDPNHTHNYGAEKKQQQVITSQKNQVDAVSAQSIANTSCQQSINAVMRGQKILFATSSATIDRQSYGLLNILAKIIRLCEMRIQISGHTDSRGAANMNMKLSQDRARAVREYIRSQGTGRSVIISVGYGETKPIANNNSAAGRRLNRRIQFTALKTVN